MTNHATLGTTAEVNGTYAPELTHAVHVITQAGYRYELASINGGAVPVYGTYVKGDETNTAVLADIAFQSKLQNTRAVTDIDMSTYDAVFYPGGFGLLSDLASNEQFAKLSAEHYESGGILAAVCHGPAALLPIVLSTGESLLSTKSVTGFTREEEIDYQTIDKIPFLLEESLTRKAKGFSKTQPWNEFVIEDNRVITGQNPASAAAVAQAMINQLKS